MAENTRHLGVFPDQQQQSSPSSYTAQLVFGAPDQQQQPSPNNSAIMVTPSSSSSSSSSCTSSDASAPSSSSASSSSSSSSRSSPEDDDDSITESSSASSNGPAGRVSPRRHPPLPVAKPALINNKSPPASAPSCHDLRASPTCAPLHDVSPLLKPLSHPEAYLSAAQRAPPAPSSVVRYGTRSAIDGRARSWSSRRTSRRIFRHASPHQSSHHSTH